MKTTLLNPEIDSIQESKAAEQTDEAPKKLLFLKDQVEKFTEIEGVDH